MNRILLISVFSILTFNIMAQEKIVQTAGRTRLGEFAPKFAELNDDVLFGEVWSRTDKLGLRDRSLVTVTSLISQGITDNSLVFHLQSAKKNGITRTEIAEIITHIHRFLCRLAESMGGVQSGKRRMGGRCRW
jgi:4-carboxymuconolactone decarboxylase